jgi:hypothetical protein
MRKYSTWLIKRENANQTHNDVPPYIPYTGYYQRIKINRLGADVEKFATLVLVRLQIVQSL